MSRHWASDFLAWKCYTRTMNDLGSWRFLFGIYCVKSVRIRSYSGRYFPAFGLNTVQLECGKIWTRITPNIGTSHSNKLKSTFIAFINASCRKWTANVEATKLMIHFHWKHEMSHLGFRDWVNNYSRIASATKKLISSYLLSVFTVFVTCAADESWSRSSVFKYESLTEIRAI